LERRRRFWVPQVALNRSSLAPLHAGRGREVAGTLFLNPRSNFENEVGAENCAIAFAVIVK